MKRKKKERTAARTHQGERVSEEAERLKGVRPERRNTGGLTALKNAKKRKRLSQIRKEVICPIRTRKKFRFGGSNLLGKHAVVA